MLSALLVSTGCAGSGTVPLLQSTAWNPGLLVVALVS
jgi:hypothetical protein